VRAERTARWRPRDCEDDVVGPDSLLAVAAHFGCPGSSISGHARAGRTGWALPTATGEFGTGHGAGQVCDAVEWLSQGELGPRCRELERGNGWDG